MPCDSALAGCDINHHPLNPRGSTNLEENRERKLRIESSEEEEGLGDKEDASKYGRIAEIDADEDLSLINETTQDQGRMNDEDLFGVNDHDGDEVIVDVTAGENVERDATVTEKEVNAVVDKVVTTAESVEGITTATTPQISKDDAKDKGKGMMVEPEKPLKKKDQIAFDEEVARKLDAQMKAEIEEEERIKRKKDEANRAVIKEWDDVQATIDADRQLAKQIQAQEKEHLSVKEGSKLLAKLIESRRKYFAAKRAKEIRNRPPTKAQLKKVMEGSKKTQAELTEDSSKRARDDIEQESAKRQRLEKEDDTAKLKRCLEIVPKDNDDVT
nr:hypothetical protein [Tanacetum cinerariifolium]